MELNHKLLKCASRIRLYFLYIWICSVLYLNYNYHKYISLQAQMDNHPVFHVKVKTYQITNSDTLVHPRINSETLYYYLEYGMFCPDVPGVIYVADS